MGFDKAVLIVAISTLSFLWIGCEKATSTSQADAELTSDQGPYTIVCTVGMIADIVRNVAGEYAEVEGIIGEGVDPHLYKPTRGDVVQLNQADVVFYNGLLLEGKMTDVLVRVASTGKPVRGLLKRYWRIRIIC